MWCDDNYEYEELVQSTIDARYGRVRELLTQGVNVDAKFDHGMTALHWACWKSSMDIAKLLIEYGADVNAKNNLEWTPLHQACSLGNLKVTKFLLANGACLNVKSSDGKTPLHWACEHHRLEVVKFLVDRGAQVNAKDDGGKTPLHLACSRAAMEIMAIFLVENGAGVNVQDIAGITPLHLACWHGQLSVVQLLLSRGADGNANSKQRLTPLYLAQERNHLDVVSVLVHQYRSLVVEPSPKRRKGGRKMSFNNENDLMQSVTAWNYARVRELVEMGVNVNIKDKDVYTPFQNACFSFNICWPNAIAQFSMLTNAKYLIQNGAQINAKDHCGKTPLHYTKCYVQRDEVGMVKLFIANGAGLNAKDNHGKTILIQACYDAVDFVNRVFGSAPLLKAT